MEKLGNYFGGKGASGTFQTIINEIRPHDVFISPFLGHDAIIRNIKPAATTIGIDASSQIINLWKEQNLKMQLINGCGINFLEKLRPENNLKYTIYCDPPYPLMSRKSQRQEYKHGLSESDHLRLLQIIKKLPNKSFDILISTYKNDLYNEHLKGWRLLKFKSQTRHGPSIEYLYMNFNNSESILHDYSYIGSNFRERERIKKKVNRWVKKLKELPLYERNAIINSLLPPADTTINNDEDHITKNIGVGQHH